MLTKTFAERTKKRKTAKVSSLKVGCWIYFRGWSKKLFFARILFNTLPQFSAKRKNFAEIDLCFLYWWICLFFGLKDFENEYDAILYYFFEFPYFKIERLINNLVFIIGCQSNIKMYQIFLQFFSSTETMIIVNYWAVPETFYLFW